MEVIFDLRCGEVMKYDYKPMCIYVNLRIYVFKKIATKNKKQFTIFRLDLFSFYGIGNSKIHYALGKGARKFV